MDNFTGFNTEKIDVNKITKQIHEKIISQGYDIDELKKLPDGIFIGQSSPLLSQRLDENIALANRSHLIQYWWDMPKEQQFFPRVKCCLKKATRRCSYFYVKQVFDQQNYFNANAVRCINDLSSYCRQLENEKNDIAAKLDHICLELLELKSQFHNAD